MPKHYSFPTETKATSKQSILHFWEEIELEIKFLEKKTELKIPLWLEQKVLE
jgi:hypothetical protein